MSYELRKKNKDKMLVAKGLSEPSLFGSVAGGNTEIRNYESRIMNNELRIKNKEGEKKSRGFGIIHNSRFLIHPMRVSGGFTLVETLVAITILTIAMTGPMVISQKGISSAGYARDQITAFYLAQEAVEYVKNVRDTNNINNEFDWLKYLNLCTNATPCKIDGTVIDFTAPGSQAVVNCGSGGCGFIKFNATDNFYGYGSGSSWSDSRFTRSIEIEEIDDDREAIVTVTIEWITNAFSTPRSFIVTEHIFNL